MSITLVDVDVREHTNHYTRTFVGKINMDARYEVSKTTLDDIDSKEMLEWVLEYMTHELNRKLFKGARKELEAFREILARDHPEAYLDLAEVLQRLEEEM